MDDLQDKGIALPQQAEKLLGMKPEDGKEAITRWSRISSLKEILRKVFRDETHIRIACLHVLPFGP